jgi:hypothetical protein
MSWVKVVRRDAEGIGNDVFIDVQLVDPAGVVGTPFQTDTGDHTFQTLGPGNIPDWQTLQTIDKPPGNSKQRPVAVILDRLPAAPTP